MDPKLLKYFDRIKDRGFTPEREKRILKELHDNRTHDDPGGLQNITSASPSSIGFYGYNDLLMLQALSEPSSSYALRLKSLDELLERDKQREEDGFPRKIRVGRLIKPGKGGKDKIVVVPTTVEEKFLHDSIRETSEEESSSGGSGEGEEGEIIGEQPVHEQDGSGSGPGEGEGGPHEMESNAYDIGKILSEHFELPNLKDKGKKRFLSRYTYDMTDRNRGFGQFLDKKATLRQIVETNISLGNIPDPGNIDPTGFLISPRDKIYRILSREKDYESQAMVFFLRDYSGSMSGKPTQLVVAQHVLLYSWLLYQYDKRVESRFILHDTDATEVPDFYTYYNSKVAGGTKVFSAFRLLNEIVEKESLARDYNIYIFYGTDGDDWDTGGKEAVPELKKMLTYSNRAGITIVEHSYGSSGNTEVEKYVKKSGFLEKHPDLLRMDVMKSDADEPRLIEGIKKLIS
ncbi:uncharacterized protein BuS5_03812 [Desulfosarcina sp. BuS5]|uniref:DUF444 family protein n=1 Tax=Desulfosarcina sp. BuS5 TaxID=933262 RepID=UPI0004885652|nr:DUF444 family protein [Desulfosarcina sp. BuS5]WDN90841.1 uncharacterized protein BuS5_03812 [Desulfosarcina sp. BuS5]